MMCKENCLSGYYKRRKPCCHECKREYICANKCRELWGECGCERLPSSQKVDRSNLT